MNSIAISQIITNPEIVNFINAEVERGENQNDVVERILSIGVAVLERVESNRDMEVIKKQFAILLTSFNNKIDFIEREVQEKIDDKIRNNFDPNIDSSYLKRTIDYLRNELEKYRGEINPLISSLKEESKLLINSAKDMTNSRLQPIEQGIRTATESFNPENETSYFSKMKNFIKEIETKIGDNFDMSKTNSYSYKLNEEVERLFGDESPLVGEIKSIINNEVLSFTTALNTLATTIAKKEQEVETTEEMKAKSTQKGKEFEFEVIECMEENIKGDDEYVTHIGDTPVAGTNNKKGDIEYITNSNYRIIIEAKDEGGRTIKSMLSYIDEAIQIRNGDFGIYVTKYDEQLPKSVDMLSYHDNNKIVTSFENLKIAIRLAKIYLKQVKVNIADGIDKNILINSLDNIQKKLKDFANIKTKLTNIQTSSDEIKSILESIKSDIVGNIELIENEINRVNENSDENIN